MYINSINANSHNNNLNFGARINENCIYKFAEIGRAMLKDNQYDTFSSCMKEIRETFSDAIINRKGGNGYCITYPRIFKEAQSKANDYDVNIDKIMKKTSLSELLKTLKDLENQYLFDMKLYKDIVGKDFVPPKAN